VLIEDVPGAPRREEGGEGKDKDDGVGTAARSFHGTDLSPCYRPAAWVVIR
jgi:hypothetical protein